jgi:CPA2 family monovalent cation:H+ antiporter-2
MTAPLIFQDLFYVWLVGLLGGLLAYAAKQPLLLGYMLGGLMISPFTPGPAVRSPETIQHMAEFGVVLLMFSLGLELAPVGLRRIGRLGLAIGTLLPLLVVGTWTAAAVQWLGWSLMESVVVGFALSISSTMVITKMLMERGELRAEHGRILLGIAIIEDCLIMGLLLYLPMMADPSQRGIASVLWVTAKTFVLLGLIFTLGLRVVPGFLRLVGRADDPELSVLVMLVLAMGIGALGVLSGLSLELGAFIAGLVLSGSEAVSQTMGRMLPMRDLFVVTFFVSLGILLDPSVVMSRWPLVSGLLGIVLVIKMAAATGLCLLLRCGWGVAWRVGVGLSQIGEFSIVLCTIARSLGLIAPDIHHVIVAVSLLSILANTFVFNLLDRGRHA